MSPYTASIKIAVSTTDRPFNRDKLTGNSICRHAHIVILRRRPGLRRVATAVLALFVVVSDSGTFGSMGAERIQRSWTFVRVRFQLGPLDVLVSFVEVREPSLGQPVDDENDGHDDDEAAQYASHDAPRFPLCTRSQRNDVFGDSERVLYRVRGPARAT